MNTVIFYFTGSGYSYLAARDLASRLGAVLVPMNESKTPETDLSLFDSVGFVFPVYHASFGLSGIPFLVGRFVSRLGDLEGKYLFAVCTHGGKPGGVLRSLEKLLAAKNGKLSSGTCVRLSVPYKTDEKIRRVFFKEPPGEDREQDASEVAVLYTKWKVLASKLAVRIRQQKSCVMGEGYRPGILKSAGNIIQMKMATARYRQLSESESGVFEVLVNESDAGFRINENCTNCGICERICPADNIRMDSGPVRLHKCENCFACYHWCPQNAVGGPLTEYEKYTQPEGVTAEELMR